MKKRALVIGVNEYEDASHINRLQYAEQDAGAMRYFLQRRCGFEVAPLIGVEATRRRINDAVYELCRNLGPDDLFVFYFAGHGYEDERGHLLLAADVRFREPKTGMAPDVVPVRGLEKMTASAGFSRLLILDACRSPLEKGRSCAALLNEAATRDLQSLATAGSGNPPLVVLCSCSPEQRAHELDQLKSGVFTEALISVLEERLATDGGFALPGDLEFLSRSTNAILRQHGIVDAQDPWCTANRGALALVEPSSVRGYPIGEPEPMLDDIPSPPTDLLWHVAVDGHPSSGMSLAALKREIAGGRIDRETHVWSEALDRWVPAGRIRELTSAFPPIDSPMPPAPPKTPIPPPAPSAIPLSRVCIDRAIGGERRRRKGGCGEANCGQSLWHLLGVFRHSQIRPWLWYGRRSHVVDHAFQLRLSKYHSRVYRSGRGHHLPGTEQ